MISRWRRKDSCSAELHKWRWVAQKLGLSIPQSWRRSCSRMARKASLRSNWRRSWVETRKGEVASQLDMFGEVVCVVNKILSPFLGASFWEGLYECDLEWGRPD
jgi:hypothetical protein